jgi:hypothetical protein
MFGPAIVRGATPYEDEKSVTIDTTSVTAAGNEGAQSGNGTQGTDRKTYVAAQLEWKVGQNNSTWYDTQDWIDSLGNGWRTPTKEEFAKMYGVLGDKTPLRNRLAWAEEKGDIAAWIFAGGPGGGGWVGRRKHSGKEEALSSGVLAVAVRSSK